MINNSMVKLLGKGIRMKKLALLFIGLIGCAQAPSVPKESIGVEVRFAGMGLQTLVDYKLSVPTNLKLMSQDGQSLAIALETKAVKRAREACGEKSFLVSQSAKQENNEISGRAIVLCIPTEKDQDQEKKDAN